MGALLDKGFGRCAPTPRINGRLMTGVELCEWLRREYPKGDCRAFAFVGASHVAGVLPEREEGGDVRYRFYDSWDCSSRKITELFLRQDAPAQSAQPAQTPKQRPDDIEPGMALRHPQYGTGCVISLTPYQKDALVTVQFETETKRILKSWALKHCFLP